MLVSNCLLDFLEIIFRRGFVFVEIRELEPVVLTQLFLQREVLSNLIARVREMVAVTAGLSVQISFFDDDWNRDKRCRHCPIRRRWLGKLEEAKHQKEHVGAGLLESRFHLSLELSAIAFKVLGVKNRLQGVGTVGLHVSHG